LFCLFIEESISGKEEARTRTPFQGRAEEEAGEGGIGVQPVPGEEAEQAAKVATIFTYQAAAVTERGLLGGVFCIIRPTGVQTGTVQDDLVRPPVRVGRQSGALPPECAPAPAQVTYGRRGCCRGMVHAPTMVQDVTVSNKPWNLMTEKFSKF